jgi:hypothetical protein
MVLGKTPEREYVEWMIDHLKAIPTARKSHLPAA